MKRLRRISVNVEHREISVSIAQTVVTSSESHPTQTPGDAAQPENCPECVALWLPDFQKALLEEPIDLDLLQAAIFDHRLHLQRLPDGQFRVCERSFQQIKEHI